MQDAIVVVFIWIVLLCSDCVCMAAGGADRGQTSEVVKDEMEKSAEDSSQGDVVKSIAFVGNRKYKDKVLLQRVDVKVGDYLDPVMAESGRRTIVEIYKKIGFAFVGVTLDSEKLSDGQIVYVIDEGPRVQIGSVKFSGNSAMKAGTLGKVLKTKKKKWFYWPNYYTEEAVTEDVVRLEGFYYGKGFLDYSITARTDFSDDRSKAYVSFIIDEGPAYRVEKIIFVGNKQFTEDTLRAGLELKQGQVYVKRKADLDAKRLVRLYRERGFLDAQVEQMPRFVAGAEAAVVNVEFGITEGRQLRIGRIDITGNEGTQDRVIRRILAEYNFTPGQLYDADMAPQEGQGKLERYVQRMVLAEEVLIRPIVPGDGEADHRDVEVHVKEGMTGMIMPGVGVSSNAGVIGRLVYQQRNFDITDWPESFGDFVTMKAFRGAGQTLRIALEPGTEVSQYSVSFSEPYFRDRPTRLDVTGSSWKRFRESYDESRLRSYVGLEQRRKGRWRPSIGFRVENVGVKSIDFDAPEEISAVKGDNILAGVRLGIGRDMTDDRFTPTTGYKFNTGYEQVTGDHTFGILGGTFLYYIPLYEDLAERRTVLATKVRAATKLADAPPFEKFYAGGTGTYGIRGFEYRGVSTRGLQTNVAIPRRKDPIGSDWIFLANTEVIMPLIGENLFALFFVDSGTIDTGRYRASIGTGIQILIPQWFGPVPMRFEFAKPLAKDDYDETRTFSFSAGGLF
jgi:outer membrane protein insertion porin family